MPDKQQTKAGKKKWFDLSNIKAGFSLSIGSYLWYIIVTLVAMALFIPGLIMVIKENKKEKLIKEGEGEGEGKEENGKPIEVNKTKKIIGFILMGLGVLFGLGFGAVFFLSLIANEF